MNRDLMPPPLRFGHLRLPSFAVGAVVCALPLSAQVTETPQTIDPGKFFLRVDAISVGLNPDSSAANQVRAVGVGWALISGGITKDVDFELGTQLFVQDTYLQDSANQTHSGIGEITLRSKWTFWRDAAADQSAALIPYVNLPTRSQVGGNGHTEGGLILPWAVQIAPGVNAGAMAEWDELRNVANTRYDARLYTSAVLQAEIFGKFGAYGEATFATSTAGSSSTWGSLNGGATWNLSDNFQWDFEVGRVLGPSARSWVQTLRFRWKL